MEQVSSCGEISTNQPTFSRAGAGEAAASDEAAFDGAFTSSFDAEGALARFLALLALRSIGW